MWYDHKVHIEETEILIHFVVCSTENDPTFVLSHIEEDSTCNHFQKRKKSELHYSLGIIPRKIKMLGIPVLTILHREKHSEFCSKPLGMEPAIVLHDGFLIYELKSIFFCFYVVYFAKLNLFAEFVPLLSEPWMHGPRCTELIGMSIFFRRMSIFSAE